MNRKKLFLSVVSAMSLLNAGSSLAQEAKPVLALEEVIVIAQKREMNAQDTTVAISVMGQDQLLQQGVTSLQDLSTGMIPTLKVAPFANSPSTLVVFMRGVGNTDAEQITKEMGVGLYLDDVYLGRAQGLGMDLADLARIEVLRGPQGTSFGRNAVGGAVNMISKRPEGEFSLEQTFTTGNFGLFESVTHVNLPSVANLSTKISYVNSSQDGWVENLDSSQSDLAELDKEGARIALQWEANDDWLFNYSYDQSKVEATSLYYQIYESTLGLEPEPRRVEKTRIPVVPLEPSINEASGHTLTAEWAVNDNLLIKSISALRELDIEQHGNYAGSLSYYGLVVDIETEQQQWSQEFQFIGENDDGTLEYTGGLYWFDEDADDSQDNYGSLIPGLEGHLIPFGPTRIVHAQSESYAAFGKATWTPSWQGLNDRLRVTAGGRYTKDEKEGTRSSAGSDEVEYFDFDTSRFDPMITLEWDVGDVGMTYLSWSQAYRAGGANIRSETFRSYDEEQIQSLEWGLKAEWFDRRLRSNVALFYSDFEDKQLDFSGRTIAIAETINATEGLEVTGVELDVSVVLAEGLYADFQYAYMDYDFPDQYNPVTDAYEKFVLPQSPRHSGSLSLNYVANTAMGVLDTNVSFSSSSRYYYSPKHFKRQGRFDLFNARVTLSEIPVNDKYGDLSLSLWGKNLTDQEWNNLSMDSTQTKELYTVSQSYGLPRSYGLSLIYNYK